MKRVQDNQNPDSIRRLLVGDLAGATFVYLALAWIPGLIFLFLINEHESADIYDLWSIRLSPQNALAVTAILLMPIVIVVMLVFEVRVRRRLNDPRSNRIWSDHLTSLSMNLFVLEFFLAMLLTLRMAYVAYSGDGDGGLGPALVNLLSHEWLFLSLIVLPIATKSYTLIFQGIESNGGASAIKEEWNKHLLKTTTCLTIWSITLVILLTTETLTNPKTSNTWSKFLNVMHEFWLPIGILAPLSYALALSVEFSSRGGRTDPSPYNKFLAIESIPIFLTVIFFLLVVAPMCAVYLSGNTSTSHTVNILVWGTSLVTVTCLVFFFNKFLRVNRLH